eukprot:scaffold102468_cov31-Tisochrysis_lutea.AAC.2
MFFLASDLLAPCPHCALHSPRAKALLLGSMLGLIRLGRRGGWEQELLAGTRQKMLSLVQQVLRSIR